MKKAISAGFIAILFFAAAGALYSPAAAAGKEKLNVFIPVNESMVGSSLTKLLREFCVTLGEHTGFDVNVEIVPYRFVQESGRMSYEALKEGRADITIFSSSIGYVQLENKVRAIATPAFTISFDKSKHFKECIYVERGSGIEEAGGLEGKIWGGTNTIPTRLLLHENGIDRPLSEFFSGMEFVFDSPPSNLVDALAEGSIDCFTANEHQLFMGGGIGGGKNESGEKIEIDSVDCTQGEHNWIFVISKDLPDSDIAKLTKKTVNAHKDKDFNKFRFMFMAIKGNFELFEDKELERTREIAELIEKHGWEKENAEFHEKAPVLPEAE